MCLIISVSTEKQLHPPILVNRFYFRNTWAQNVQNYWQKRSFVQSEHYYELIGNGNAERATLNTSICLPLRQLNMPAVRPQKTDPICLNSHFYQIGLRYESGILPEVHLYWLKAAVQNCRKHLWNKVLLVLQCPASLRLGWLCCRNLESFADSSFVTCSQRWFTPVCINSLWCLCFPGSDHGSAGTEVSGSQQDCLLHHGGGGGREAPDWPGRGIQTNVSASHYILQQKGKKKRWQFSNFSPLFKTLH